MTLRYDPIQYLPMGSRTIGTMEPREDGEWVNYNAYAEALDAIEELEIRHAATMLHTQTIVDEANTTRQQRDRLAEALQSLMRWSDCTNIPNEVQKMCHTALAAVKPQPAEP